MRFLEDTDLLKIEDILPFFPDFVVIDDFKEEIAHALEGYSAHIDDLKKEMDDATRTAESIKQDIVELKSRFVTIDAGERCSVCAQLLLTRQSYIFPCQHTFHADCLIGLVSCTCSCKAVMTRVPRQKNTCLLMPSDGLLLCRQNLLRMVRRQDRGILPAKSDSQRDSVRCSRQTLLARFQTARRLRDHSDEIFDLLAIGCEI